MITPAMNRSTVTPKHVRDNPVKAALDEHGGVTVSVKSQGVGFSFPLALWPADSLRRAGWIERLTPHWDLGRSDWSPLCRAPARRVPGSRECFVRAPCPENREAADRPVKVCPRFTEEAPTTEHTEHTKGMTNDRPN